MLLGGQMCVDVGTRVGLGAMLQHNAELGPQLVQRQRPWQADSCHTVLLGNARWC